MTFVKRKIALTFKLGKGGTFGETGADTVRLTGHRVSCRIEKIAGPGLGTAEIRIFGLDQSLMNQLSDLNTAATVIRNNIVTVEAGDDVNGMATVFQGLIIVGQQCLNTAPDTSLLVIAQAGTALGLKPTPALSYPGTADAAIVLFNAAQQAGWNFVNSGVSVQLSTPYYEGSAREKVARCAIDADIKWTVEDDTLYIWPADGARSGAIPIISPDTGMVGYPNYATSAYGLDIQTLFNPLLRVGGLVQIVSSLGVANGTFYTFGLSHDLESETPGGKWFTNFRASTMAQGASA